ncbi:hypothetical protein EJ110_NYTH11916 [Nymphaea thermarum]|nr:hypothetical protein EJ110_NYTH11916 [Nymphaea thermarum]
MLHNPPANMVMFQSPNRRIPTPPSYLGRQRDFQDAKRHFLSPALSSAHKKRAVAELRDERERENGSSRGPFPKCCRAPPSNASSLSSASKTPSGRAFCPCAGSTSGPPTPTMNSSNTSMTHPSPLPPLTSKTMRMKHRRKMGRRRWRPGNEESATEERRNADDVEAASPVGRAETEQENGEAEMGDGDDHVEAPSKRDFIDWAIAKLDSAEEALSYEFSNLEKLLVEVAEGSEWLLGLPEEDFWSTVELPSCLTNNLKAVEFVPYRETDGEIQLLAAFLRNASVLQYVYILIGPRSNSTSGCFSSQRECSPICLYFDRPETLFLACSFEVMVANLINREKTLSDAM